MPRTVHGAMAVKPSQASLPRSIQLITLALTVCHLQMGLWACCPSH